MSDPLSRQLERLWARGHQTVTPEHPSLAVMIGLDRAGRGYDWDGLRRRSDPRGPELIIQVTLEGWGEFSDREGAVQRVGPGQLFTAIIPSRHRYRWPRASPGWRFWWTQILHPDAVTRGAAAIAAGGHVHALPPAGELAAALLAITAAVRAGRYRDELQLERDAIAAAIELQRLVRAEGSPAAAGWRLESAVRARIMADPGHPPGVEELAAADGRSPSAFGHRFRTLTGHSPARFVTRVRLEGVRRALETSDETLATIAQRFGFADPNHLCKVFRRHHGSSPGAWRAQAHGRTA